MVYIHASEERVYGATQLIDYPPVELDVGWYQFVDRNGKAGALYFVFYVNDLVISSSYGCDIDKRAACHLGGGDRDFGGSGWQRSRTDGGRRAS